MQPASTTADTLVKALPLASCTPQACSNSVERAADWLFSHMDDMEVAVAGVEAAGAAAATGAAAGPAAEGAAAGEPAAELTCPHPAYTHLLCFSVSDYFGRASASSISASSTRACTTQPFCSWGTQLRVASCLV